MWLCCNWHTSFFSLLPSLSHNKKVLISLGQKHMYKPYCKHYKLGSVAKALCQVDTAHLGAKSHSSAKVTSDKHDDKQVCKTNGVWVQDNLCVCCFVKFHWLLLDIANCCITDQSTGDHQHTCKHTDPGFST